VFAGLVAHFLDGEDRQVAAGDRGRLLHRARHGFGDHLQVGRAELVGERLDAARVAVAGLLFLGAAGEGRGDAERKRESPYGEREFAGRGIHSWLLRMRRKSTALLLGETVLTTR